MHKIAIFLLSEIHAQGKKLAFVKGNRKVELKGKNIKAKKKSLFYNDQVIPIIVVKASVAIEQGLECVAIKDDGTITEDVISKEDADKYYVIIDGQHRTIAHLQMSNYGYVHKNENGEVITDIYNGDLVLMLPISEKAAVSKMLAEINTCTSPWKGGELVSCVSMVVEEDAPVLDRMAELTNSGYSQESASKWLTFRKTTIKQFSDAISGKVDVIFKNTDKMKRGNRLIEAASATFGEDFLKTRTLVDWVVSKYDDTPDSDKPTIIDKIIEFFGNISEDDAKEIVSYKGKRGGETRESKINNKLNELYKA